MSQTNQNTAKADAGQNSVSSRPLYTVLAQLINARANCEASGNTEWYTKHEGTVEALVKSYMPSGSGFDCGTEIDWDQSTDEKLVFTASYHHMDENGGYDGWTDHKITVTPSLAFAFELKISGKDRNGFKEYAREVFHQALSDLITY